MQLSKHSAPERRHKDVKPITSVSLHAKELPLRTSLVRDSVKKRIFACMDRGDTSAEIELKSSLSHLMVKRYRRMWKDERRDPRLRSKKRSRRKAQSQSRVASCEPVQLPSKQQLACAQMSTLSRVHRDKGERKHRAARGLKEREANPRMEDAGSRVQESVGLQMKPSGYPLDTENQLVMRLSEKPT